MTQTQPPSLFLDAKAMPLEGKDRAMVDAGVFLISQMSSGVFAADNLISFGKTAGFTSDPDFLRAAEAINQPALVQRLAWRLHTLCWAARRALAVEGAFVEFGVFQGFKSAFLAQYLNFNALDRDFYLYDTFAGIPERYAATSPIAPGVHAQAGLVEYVRKRFSRWPRIRVVQAMVPDEVIPADLPERIAYAHIDMNSAEAETGAYELIFERLSTGATIVLDDYGWEAFSAQKAAADAFFGARGLPVLELPTGQGMVIR